MFFSSELSDGDMHKHDDLPVALLGSLGGAIGADGRHVAHVKYTFPRTFLGPSGGPLMGNLFISILRAFGVQATRFGENGTAPLVGVTG